MDIPKLGVKSELQLPATTTATAILDSSPSSTYTAAQGNAGSLTHWARPGIELTSLWILVGFISAASPRELPVATLKSILYWWGKHSWEGLCVTYPRLIFGVQLNMIRQTHKNINEEILYFETLCIEERWMKCRKRRRRNAELGFPVLPLYWWKKFSHVKV